MPTLVCPNTVVKDLVIEFSSPSLCRSVRTKTSNMNDHEAVIAKITPGLKSTLFRVLATVAAVIVLQACNSSGDDNGEIIGFSYVDELDNVYEPFQPELGAAVPVAARAALEAANLPYPPFNPHNIKSIGPSGWLNRNELVQAGVGDVIFNQLWSVCNQVRICRSVIPIHLNTITWCGGLTRSRKSRSGGIHHKASMSLQFCMAHLSGPEGQTPAEWPMFH